MRLPLELVQVLQINGFKVSTDTRKEVAGTVYFALKGENFDGSIFIPMALEKGAVAVVTENEKYKGDRVYVVTDVLKVLQESAHVYRETFSIPILAIGGSNGKTTTRELVREVLATKYRVHSSKENLNNHIGVPLSILAMGKETEIGVFEIGANHPGEHLILLDILEPTHVLVTNNGLDHLEGFGSPAGVRAANKEIYDWAGERGAHAFVSEYHADLLADSEALARTLYRVGAPVETKLIGDYNLENIYAALAVAHYFEVPQADALKAVASYEATNNRSQRVEKDGNTFILDCYNANPSSMRLALESFAISARVPRGVILGDMLELGSYAEAEHRKIVGEVSQQAFEQIIFIGEHFKKALEWAPFPHQWFPNSEAAGEWFAEQKFMGFTFLLKGSRGLKVEKVVGK
jgi:UDP-N-acetylmuramoyl-tripeptide--D-alanyl-D-alanine ligase